MGFAVAALMAFAVSCGSPPAIVEPPTPVPTTMTLSITTVDLTFIGHRQAVTASVRDQNGDPIVPAPTVTWTTDDASIASVTATGLIEAEGQGTTQVHATSGSLSESVTVNVSQVAIALAIASGSGQEAIRDSTLADPIVVVARDQSGAGVPGLSVTFTPDSANGFVSDTMVVTDSNGEASTQWTLGTPFGIHRLVATSDSLTTEVTALARSETPTPDLEVDSAFTVIRSDPSTLDTINITARIRNTGDGDSGAGFRVAVMSGATEVGTVNMAALTAGDSAIANIQVLPLAAGPHTLRVVVDADDDIVELIESLNEASRNISVVAQATLTDGVPVTGISGTGAAGIGVLDFALFKIDVPPGPNNVLTVTTAGGGPGQSPDADLYIEGGERPSDYLGYDDCISTSGGSAETCQIIGAEGTYHIGIQAWNTYSSLSLTASLGTTSTPFNIELVFLDNGTPSQDSAFITAAARWEELIVGDVWDIPLTVNADVCEAGQQPINNETIDDIRIYITIAPDDGPGMTLGSAGPCIVRGSVGPPRFGSLIPAIGTMTFDEADVPGLEASGSWEAVILHEMGHALGLGTIWNARGLLINPSQPNNQGADTHFPGEHAIVEFDAAGGAGHSGSKVPVENQAGPGSADGHWREATMNTELMTPFLDGGQPNPLSRITVASMQDLGYSVDLGAADAYSVPAPAFSAPLGPDSPGVIDLRNDIRQGPIYVVDAKGNVIEILR